MRLASIGLESQWSFRPHEADHLRQRKMAGGGRRQQGENHGENESGGSEHAMDGLKPIYQSSSPWGTRGNGLREPLVIATMGLPR